jgi:hypothetical protein
MQAEPRSAPAAATAGQDKPFRQVVPRRSRTRRKREGCMLLAS